VDYQPLDNGGATRVTLTDTSGVLATGIEFIRFTANQVNGGLNGGAFIWRELDVFGVPSGDDETSPVALSFSPADNASGVLPTVPLAVTFDEKIQLGSGNVTLKNLSSQSEVVLPVTSPNLSVSDATLTITPSAYLESNTAYAVRIDPTAITDAAGNAFAGINDDTTWNFGTGELDLTSPTIVTFHPATNAEAVPVDTSLVVTFNETIVKGTGTITIKNLDAATETTLAVNSAAVSVLGKVLTIQPGTRFAGNANHSIQIAAGAVKDAAGNGFEGIADDTTWTFNTAAAPLRIMALGDSISVGYTDNPGWANHPFQFGYRSGLYSRLTQANYPFKFVGASPEPWSGTSGDPTHGGTYTPLLDLRSLGQDGHRGYGGASIAAINSSVASYIASDQPDVILLMIGINGISGNSATELNTLVSTIFTASPDVHLIVAQITPLVSFNQSLYDYNLYIRDILVPNYASNGFKVSTVDLYSLFLTDPNNYSSAIAPGVLSNNINHPDNAHYDLMAQRWFEGIEALGLGTGSLTFNSWIATYPAIAGQTGFDQDPDGDGIGNGLENFFGTAPDAYTKGVVADAAVGNTFVFTHPQNPSPASNISGAYRWTKNLVDFHADGDTDAAGTKVEFTTELNTPTEGTTTVTATISGPTPSKLFVEVVATHAP
jgi:lysophospholipase L1-like esterase